MTIEVEMIADSVAAETGSRISTMVLRYPRMVHSEFMTHRKFGRNASSSRAIPMQKMHKSVREEPALPEKWTMNQQGMQGYQEASPEIIEQAKRIIAIHREQSIETAEQLAALGLHKQVFNRYTEPHQHIRVVVTSSDWQNFLLLRTHETAEPTMQALANTMLETLANSKPKRLDRGDWHLPYYDEEELPLDTVSQDILDAVLEMPEHLWEAFPPYDGKGRSIAKLIKVGISAARCARVSYNNFEGKRSSPVEDLKLFAKLIVSQPIHASPLEHQATPDWMLPGRWIPQRPSNMQVWSNPHQHGNLTGWRQARKFIPGEDGSNWG